MKRRFLFALVVATGACGEKMPASVAGPRRGGAMIKLAPLKVTPAKRGKDKVVELRDDGAVLIDGRRAAKIAGDHVESADGTSMLTVGVNGSLVGSRVAPGFKFDGDDLVTDAGAKLSVDADGAIIVTRDRDTEILARMEGASSGKRAALIATVLWLTIPMYVTTDTSKADVAP